MEGFKVIAKGLRTTENLGISPERHEELEKQFVATVFSPEYVGAANKMNRLAQVTNNLQEYGFLCKQLGQVEMQLNLKNMPPEDYRTEYVRTDT